MRPSTNQYLSITIAFLAAAGLIFAVSAGVAASANQAADAVQVTSADPGSTPMQPEDITSNPPPGIDADPVAQPIVMPADPNRAAMVKRGEYLAVAGDCQYCHSVPGGSPFAGGQPVQTPFGDLFSPNITPDKKFGIGSWSDAQFWNALHSGIGPGHSLLVFPHYLYPVMPWQDYNKLSRPDVMAIKAYLDSIQPVAQQDRPTQMSFPFTIRAGLLAWRLLFFRDHPIRYDPSWSPQVRDGAFLVLALGHCSECHTQRNLLMATEPSRYLAGGHILAQSWYAPNITMSKTDGIGGWSASDLFNFLYRDGALGTGGPYGPMRSVVDDSLSRLPASSVQDIVAYLQQATPSLPSQIPPATSTPMTGLDGAQLYADNCARCHGGNGEGVENNFPNLAGNESVWDGPAQDIESMILGGFQPWHSGQSSMPEFNQNLSDGEIAAIANYVRTSWGNKGVADATPAEVASQRLLASDWVELSTGSMVAKLQGSGASEGFDDIFGRLEMFGHHDNCMLKAHFTDDAPAASVKSADLYGACAKQGSVLQGVMMVDGKPYPVAFNLFAPGGLGLSNIFIFGQLPGTGDKFNARIALVSPSY